MDTAKSLLGTFHCLQEFMRQSQFHDFKEEWTTSKDTLINITGVPCDISIPFTDPVLVKCSKENMHSNNVDDIISAPEIQYRIISAEEFDNILPHIRGRCVLGDVNKVLRKIQDDYFTQSQPQRNLKKESKPITLQRLDAMGCKVFGNSGNCVIKTLQHLQCIKLTQKGDTTYISFIHTPSVNFSSSLRSVNGEKLMVK